MFDWLRLGWWLDLKCSCSGARSECAIGWHLEWKCNFDWNLVSLDFSSSLAVEDCLYRGPVKEIVYVRWISMRIDAVVSCEVLECGGSISKCLDAVVSCEVMEMEGLFPNVFVRWWCIESLEWPSVSSRYASLVGFESTCNCEMQKIETVQLHTDNIIWRFYGLLKREDVKRYVFGM